MLVCGRNIADEYSSKKVDEVLRVRYMLIELWTASASFLMSSDKRHAFVPPSDALPNSTILLEGISGRRPMACAFSTLT